MKHIINAFNSDSSCKFDLHSSRFSDCLLFFSLFFNCLWCSPCILNIISNIFFFQIQQADVIKETKQFTYKDGAQYVFMDLVCEYMYNLTNFRTLPSEYRERCYHDGFIISSRQFPWSVLVSFQYHVAVLLSGWIVVFSQMSLICIATSWI